MEGTSKSPTGQSLGSASQQYASHFPRHVKKGSRKAADQFSISEDEMKRIRKPSSQVRFPEEAGGGFVAGLEIFHQVNPYPEAEGP